MTPPEAWFVRHRYLFILALGVFLFVSFLGTRDLWYPDEPDIGEVAQAMYVSGDWISPRRNGEIWVDYWPLLYWAGALCSHLVGGVSEFSLRLASALGGIALALLTSVVASRRFGARTGLWTGVILITFSQFLYGSISYRPDMLFSLAIAGGFFAYAAGVRRSGVSLRALGFALFGVAILTKGPLGLLLPGLVLTLWHGSRREWRALLQLVPLALVSLAVALPWALACADAMGVEKFWGEIWAQNFGRYGSGSRGHGKPLHYYALVIWADMGPWVFMLPVAVHWLYRTGRARDRDVQLLLWWFATFFVFLSVAATKRQVYLMPAYPAVALLLAPWFAGCSGARKGMRRAKSGARRPASEPACGSSGATPPGSSSSAPSRWSRARCWNPRWSASTSNRTRPSPGTPCGSPRWCWGASACSSACGSSPAAGPTARTARAGRCSASVRRSSPST